MTTAIGSTRTWQLLNMLADGEFHSGQVLAKRLGVSRASVFNALADVAVYGILLQRIRGRGYRLAHPWQRLERQEILRWLGEDAGQFVIEILPQTASSNTLLLQRAGPDGMTRRARATGAGVPSPRLLPQSAGFASNVSEADGMTRRARATGAGVPSPRRLPQSAGFASNVSEAAVANGAAPSGSVLAVELQTAGRGRMGRAWHSGLGTGLTFSLLWRFDCGLNGLSGLSLAVGVAIARALDKLGAQGVKLKWPNDILTGQGKLAGVLIEAQGDMLGPSAVVIGIGLNCFLPDGLPRRIDQPASALNEVCAAMPTRNQLLAVLLQELAFVLQQFARHGFSALRNEWQQYHVHQDRPVQLHMPDGSVVSGVARGVSDNGELCLETAQGMRRFNSGEVGVRLRDGGAEHSGAGATASHPLPQRKGGSEAAGDPPSYSSRVQSGLPANVSRVRK